jgi:hypothetical protein
VAAWGPFGRNLPSAAAGMGPGEEGTGTASGEAYSVP